MVLDAARRSGDTCHPAAVQPERFPVDRKLLAKEASFLFGEKLMIGLGGLPNQPLLPSFAPVIRCYVTPDYRRKLLIRLRPAKTQARRRPVCRSCQVTRPPPSLTRVDRLSDPGREAIPHLASDLANDRAGLSGIDFRNAAFGRCGRSNRTNHIRKARVRANAFDTDRLRGPVAVAEAQKRGISVDHLIAEHGKSNPAGRVGNPEEFGLFCAFLCGAKAGFITGQNILLDGGAFPGTL